ncbi:MAG: hypothetical protein PHD37_00415 [Gallionellaceae bacterium]|nr:hypothetical protein [Gallionellaceae bacterium]
MIALLARCLLPLLLAAPIHADWHLVSGAATALAATPQGDAYALGGDGEIWHWRHESGNWGHLSGQLLRVAVGPDGHPCGIDPSGAVVRHNGLWWEPLGKQARELAVDGNGNIWVILADDGIARYNPRGGDWDSVPGQGRRIAVETDGRPWLLGADGAIRRLRGKDWETLPGSARELAAGSGGVFILDPQGQPWLWREEAGRWEAIAAPERLAVLAAGAPGTLWAATATGAIYSSAPPPAAKREARTPLPGGQTQLAPRKSKQQRTALAALGGPGRLTDPSPIQFVDTRAQAASIAIGAEGSVFALAADGSVHRWNNEQHRFLDFPGSFTRLAVDVGGHPWGVNRYGRIYRHDGIDWRQVRGSAVDIAIGADASVFTVDAAAVLWRYDPAITGFLRRDGSAARIAVDPTGTPWGLLDDGGVVRCAHLPCERFERKANSLAIGPDGSVFIATQNGRMEWRKVDSGDWSDVPVAGQTPVQVAVGPKGRPWVVTAGGEVYAAAFFPRDESEDLQVATTTHGDTLASADLDVATGAASTATTFVFNKRMRFKSYPTPPNYDGLKVGADGIAYARDYTGATWWQFDNRGRTFKTFSPMPPEVYQTMQSGPDGALWVLSGATDGRVFRLRPDKTWETFNLPGPRRSFCIRPPCTEENKDLAVGADGAVYVLDNAGALYRKAANAAVFAKLLNGPFWRLAAGSANDVWVISNPPGFELFQVVGGRLEPRPRAPASRAYAIAAGADGSVYAVLPDPVTSLWQLAKWNSGNRSFDAISGVVADLVAVGPDGRPWYNDFSLSTDIYIAQ